MIRNAMLGVWGHMKEWITKLSNNQLVSYLFVGGGATLVEWLSFWIFDSALGIQYLVSTILAMVVSTFSNWLFGRLWTFRNAEKQNIWLEIGKVYAAAAVGILLNLLIRRILVGTVGIQDMVAKIIATIIVFAYNFLIRKLVIYRK